MPPETRVHQPWDSCWVRARRCIVAISAGCPNPASNSRIPTWSAVLVCSIVLTRSRTSRAITSCADGKLGCLVHCQLQSFSGHLICCRNLAGVSLINPRAANILPQWQIMHQRRLAGLSGQLITRSRRSLSSLLRMLQVYQTGVEGIILTNRDFNVVKKILCDT